ncbi:hypothetical protein QBC33DRAFT_523421 [Phialemonium atrogriseum]|uniref:Uncharacterized protein n=1 Tax=Phialemonium atrogriseum TaxID=1093897 RepID=A0AAJ0C737_9PEZI|nr:uncharacterized protein QBC33DRAFT_523421 [Phialemonium atrogriseum]KAK1771353.1 hypothetical protein QBC33DRAFT_523421 [Phialemonium atrogriseum]
MFLLSFRFIFSPCRYYSLFFVFSPMSPVLLEATPFHAKRARSANVSNGPSRTRTLLLAGEEEGGAEEQLKGAWIGRGEEWLLLSRLDQ